IIIFSKILFNETSLYPFRNTGCKFYIDSKGRKAVGVLMETVLKIDGLNKSFKDKQVLHNITFEVKKGEVMAILGPNGAGKSTTIRNIMGIMYPDEGTITFQNQNGGQIPKNKIGYLPEERGLYKNVKV